MGLGPERETGLETNGGGRRRPRVERTFSSCRLETIRSGRDRSREEANTLNSCPHFHLTRMVPFGISTVCYDSRAPEHIRRHAHETSQNAGDRKEEENARRAKRVTFVVDHNTLRLRLVVHGATDRGKREPCARRCCQDD